MLTHPAAFFNPATLVGLTGLATSSPARHDTMSISFPKTEEEVLRQWKEVDAFQTQLKLTEDGPRFTFYDGPPFGTCCP